MIGVGGTFIGIGIVVALVGYFNFAAKKRQTEAVYGKVDGDPEESVEEVQVTDEPAEDEIIQ